jgi:hypothetical protein
MRLYARVLMLVNASATVWLLRISLLARIAK